MNNLCCPEMQCMIVFIKLCNLRIVDRIVDSIVVVSVGVSVISYSVVVVVIVVSADALDGCCI